MAHCVVEDVAKGRLSARVLDRRTVPAATPAVTVVQALPKSDRSELAIELATEAGADAFIAWQASRCVARWDGRAKVDKGLYRWGAVARSAARQSRRPYIPPVTGVVSTAELAHRVRDGGATTLVLHESATIKLTELPVAQAHSLLLVVGPEGGITDDEIAELSASGATPVGSGRRYYEPLPPRPSRWAHWARSPHGGCDTPHSVTIPPQVAVSIRVGVGWKSVLHFGGGIGPSAYTATSWGGG